MHSISSTTPVWEKKYKDDVCYLSCEKLEETGLVKHGFSTRIGGISKGIFESMNLSFSRGDDDVAVRENFKRFANAIDVNVEDLVFTHQTHTINVREVKEEDKGKGIITPLDYQDVDGLITNVPGLCLTTFYADCVPLFVIDPVHKAIGLSHSGWRGTVAKMGQATLEKMKETYGTEAKDAVVAVGPSICQSCYEVSEEVVVEFQKAFHEKWWDDLFYKKENGKYQLNLWKANEIIFLECGVKKENIAVTDICTNCNPELLWSHRATKGERGSLAAFMALK